MQIRHLDGTKCGLRPLVTVLASGPFQGLVDGIGGENPKENRDLPLESGLGDSPSCRFGYEFEVWGLAADHGAETDDGIVITASRQHPCGLGNLERARNHH